ncbi:MAG: hypothetical protein A2Z34_10475 [Planctomycetes bacterium RBG_16_59_8]|nr:MAG: hypothetical protein A2Z34_10475 [Planctomycetes bacterium RBG_16_59_8]
MNKALLFGVGTIFGIAAVAAFLLATQGQQGHALLQTADRAGDLLVATGGTQAQVNNIFWVVRKGDEYTHLAVYKIEGNEREMKLLAARNITFDLQIETQHNNLKPFPEEIKEILEKAQEKKKRPK